MIRHHTYNHAAGGAALEAITETSMLVPHEVVKPRQPTWISGSNPKLNWSPTTNKYHGTELMGW